MTPDGAYLRAQIETFLSEKAGYRVKVLEMVEVSGSQHTQYCGNMGTPDGDGELRWFTIDLWSHAETDHQIASDELECGEGRLHLRAGEFVPPDQQGLQPQGTLAFGTVRPQSAPAAAPVASSAGTGPMYALIDRVTTYAVLVGRGLGCGIDVKPQIESVGAWLDRVAPPGSEAQQTLLPMFTQQSQYHASQQLAGRSPDSCATVARAIRNHSWPG